MIPLKLLKWLCQSPTTSSNKISPVCILINGGEKRHKLAGLMGPIPLKYHMSDSGETELEGGAASRREEGKGSFTERCGCGGGEQSGRVKR